MMNVAGLREKVVNRSRPDNALAVFFSVNIKHYYMPSAVSGQDEPNLALWLATQPGNMELSCLLGILRALSRKYTDHALVFLPI